MIGDVEHLLLYLLPFICLLWRHCTSPKHPVSFCLFFNRVISLLLICKCSLYILHINPLSHIWFTSIFSHSVGCLFTIWTVSFAVQKLFSLM
uniref:Uncharacterized protein n=1 Tax=Bos indicus x Bos taurus TaxID=30522 RepID=A0A4W2HZ32_BOBOX